MSVHPHTLPEPTCSVLLACIALCWDWNCNNTWSPDKHKIADSEQ